MNSSHDLDINNYSTKDLEKLFHLKPKQYTEVDIDKNMREFYARIMNSSGDFDPNNKTLMRELSAFILSAGELLMYSSRNKKDKNTGIGSAYISKKNIPDVDYYNPEPDVNAYMNSGFTPREKFGRTDEIIKKKLNPYSTVIQNEYNEGNMNPLYTPILTRCLNIDTRFRENLYSTQSSDFTFTLPVKVKKVVSMQLSAYEMPVSFYGTSKTYGNNFLNVICNYQYPSMALPARSTKTVILPDGNYSAADILTRINSQLQPINPVDGTLLDTSESRPTSIFNCVQFTIDIDQNLSGSGKVTISVSDIPTFAHAEDVISIEFDFTLDVNEIPSPISVTSRIGWNLGFIQTKYKGSKTYTSDTLPEPASIRYLYLVVNDFNNSVNNHFVGAFSNWILNNNILARIPVNGSYFSIMMESDLSQHIEPRKYFGPVDIQRLNLQLLDDHGRVLDMNSANYSLCLTFKCLYD
jgi:hypothetical protein